MHFQHPLQTVIHKTVYVFIGWEDQKKPEGYKTDIIPEGWIQISVA